MNPLKRLCDAVVPKYNLGDEVIMRNLKGQWEPCTIIGLNGCSNGEWTYAISWGGVVLEYIPESEFSESN